MLGKAQNVQNVCDWQIFKTKCFSELNNDYNVEESKVKQIICRMLHLRCYQQEETDSEFQFNLYILTMKHVQILKIVQAYQLQPYHELSHTSLYFLELPSNSSERIPQCLPLTPLTTGKNVEDDKLRESVPRL